MIREVVPFKIYGKKPSQASNKKGGILPGILWHVHH